MIKEESLEVVETVELKVDITRGMIENVIISAFEGGTYGIGYWCNKTEDRFEQDEVDYPYEETLWRGGSHLLHVQDDDEESETVYELTLGKLIEGFSIYLRGYYDGPLNELEGRLDGPTSDIIVQLAIFNEIVYG